MRFQPHPYQTSAIEWVVNKKRCALFLDMGLGKTVSTLSAIRLLMDCAEVERTLVVAPKKVAESTWASECAKWDHLNHLKVVKVMGTANQRTEALNQEADIYVVGRDTLPWMLEHFGNRFPFDCLVLDELTSFKNPKAQRFKVVKKWTRKVSRVIGLTGTPTPNSLLDLWAQLYCIDQGERLGKFVTKFREQYFNAIQLGHFATKYTIRNGSERQILDKIADICLTMQAKDYLTLPELTEITERIELPATLMKRYAQFERDQVATLSDTEITATNAAAMMNKLSQFASGCIYDDDHMVHHVHDEKVDRLAEIVEQAQSPVLVFYQFKHEVSHIAEKLKGYKVRTYEGEAELNDWNEGKIDVLLAHPASTAYGLNMQHGGHYIVWYGTGFNLEQYQQANARLHRQGQKHHVTAYRLVCAGTVDELANAAIERKAGVQQGVIDSLKELIKKYDL